MRTLLARTFGDCHDSRMTYASVMSYLGGKAVHTGGFFLTGKLYNTMRYEQEVMNSQDS